MFFFKTTVSYTQNFHLSWLSGDKNTYYFSSILKFNELPVVFKLQGASGASINKTDV